MIHDTRPCSAKKFRVIADEKAETYEICETPHDFHSLFTNIKEKYPMDEMELRSHLLSLIDNNLMLCDNNKYLSLAIPVRR